MLAQNFKPPTDLRISDREQVALIKVLGMLERGEISQRMFDMSTIGDGCGTVGCLMGWAKFVSGDVKLFDDLHETQGHISPLHHLFMFCVTRSAQLVQRASVRPAQAAMALRSYLTTGDADWAEALSLASTEGQK